MLGKKVIIRSIGNTNLKFYSIPLRFFHDLKNSDLVHILKKRNSGYDLCKSHSPIYIEDKGESVCCQCGLVLREKEIRTSKDSRIFTQEDTESKEHYGAPITALLPDIQMATMVRKRDARTRCLKKALRWDTRYTWDQRNIMMAISEIKRMGTLLQEPKRVKEYAAILYKKASKRGLLKGRSIPAMAAACLYYAGRAENISTPLHKLVEYSGLSKHNIVICFYSLIKTFKINSPPVSPMSMLSKHISDLHLSHSCEMLVLELMNFYMKSKLFAGKDPKGLVAAAIYFVILKKNINRTQKDIVEHVGVSEVTMRKRLVEIYELVDRLHKR